MKRTLAVGIVGAGTITTYHIDGYLKAGAKVVAIADTNIASAKSRARQYGIEGVFSDYREMLEKTPEISAISVCTPNFSHADISVHCLNAEKDVFCEKPPALNSKQVISMKEAAEKNGRILMFNFNNRARPDVQALFKHVRDGEIGKINSAQALWIRRNGIPGFGGWFTQKALSGGGPVIDLLHMIDLALYFMDYPDPEWVLAQTFNDFATDHNFKGPWGIPDVENGTVDVETASHAFVTFKTKQVLFARNSWAEQNKREEVSLTFQGTKAGGMVRRLFKIDGIDDTSIDSSEIYTVDEGVPINRRLLAPVDPKMGREKAVMNFANTVLGKEEPLNEPQQAVTLLKILDGIYESANTRKPVKIV